MVVDRVVVRADIAQRLAESFEQALKLADGIAVVEFADAAPSSPSPRLRGEGRGEGASPQAQTRGDAPSPASHDPPSQAGEDRERATSPRKRGEVKETKLATAAAADAQRITFSEKFACPVSGFTISEIEPRLFSFNNPFGACPACGGLGVEQHIDAELVIPDKSATLRRGAIAPW